MSQYYCQMCFTHYCYHTMQGLVTQQQIGIQKYEGFLRSQMELPRQYGIQEALPKKDEKRTKLLLLPRR